MSTAPPYHTSHRNTPVLLSPPSRGFCLCSSGPPTPTHPWKSPSQHSSPLKAFPDLVPSGSCLSRRASPTQKPGSKPHVSRPPRPSPHMPSTSSPGPQRRLVLMLSGLKHWAPALKQQGSTTGKWHFTTSQAPNCQGSPQAFCAAFIHPQSGPVPGTLPPPSPYPTLPTSSPANGL